MTSAFRSDGYCKMNLILHQRSKMSLTFGLKDQDEFDFELQVSLGSKTHDKNHCFQNRLAGGLRAETFDFQNLNRNQSTNYFENTKNHFEDPSNNIGPKTQINKLSSRRLMTALLKMDRPWVFEPRFFWGVFDPRVTCTVDCKMSSTFRREV